MLQQERDEIAATTSREAFAAILSLPVVAFETKEGSPGIFLSVLALDIDQIRLCDHHRQDLRHQDGDPGPLQRQTGARAGAERQDPEQQCPGGGGHVSFVQCQPLRHTRRGSNLTTTHATTIEELPSFLMLSAFIVGNAVNLTMVYANAVKTFDVTECLIAIIDDNAAAETSNKNLWLTTAEAVACHLITIEGLHFSFPLRPTLPVLDDFSLHVPAGTSVGITGPYGCGKFVVLKVLTGIYPTNAAPSASPIQSSAPSPCGRSARTWRWSRGPRSSSTPPSETTSS